ncbi:MAG: RelA/SpoT family protein [Bacteroidales bacterium]|nr:RelA/SpoT family protein [Bacteroidales bacterium]
MSFSLFTQQDYDLINHDWEQLYASAKIRCTDENELAVVRKAFEFANEAHKNVRRRSGEPYMLHPIAVAQIVVDNIGLGYKSITAALLHDVVEDTDFTTEDIKNLFGEKVASLVDGLTKIKTVLDNENRRDSRNVYTESVQAENLKRILLTLNDDARISLIKLADRLHNCRTIEFMPEHKRDKILSETMFIFIPLAHRLGLYEVKSELENIWLRYKEPDVYKDICSRIDRNVEVTDKKIDDFISPIANALTKAGFEFEIKKRVKTPYSIWHKMQTKNVTFDQVYDLYAVRIIFNQKLTEPERDQCYHIFSIITGLYRYQPSRVRDWVKHPKSNGYEALHCTLMSQFGSWVEVQIRSRRMDDIAEKGIAAHWTYKKEGYITETESEMDKWLQQVSDLLKTKDINSLELLDIIHNDLINTDIVLFTPKGEQKTMQKGASVLDFAYQIHTDIGNKAIAGKVNMKLVPLSHTLMTGDQVEIVTAQNGYPKREWLQFLKTRQARSKVIDYFKDYRETIVAEGEARLKKEFLSLGKEFTNRSLRRILYSCNLRESEELYFRYGLGIIPLSSISLALTEAPEKAKAEKNERFIIDTSAESPRKYIISECCKPIPGDPVVGFLNPDGSVEIHKKTCPRAELLGSIHGDWMIVPEWKADDADKPRDYLVRLSLGGIDRLGLLNDISSFMATTMGLSVKRVFLNTDGEIFDGYIEFMVNDRNLLERIIFKLQAIKGIHSVIRTDI